MRRKNPIIGIGGGGSKLSHIGESALAAGTSAAAYSKKEQQDGKGQPIIRGSLL
jgi:hypothetical protein